MSIKDYLEASQSQIVMIFGILIGLVIAFKIVSLILEKSKKNQGAVAQSEETDCNSEFVEEDRGLTAGQLKLIGTDEKTAALIMAIVSDESAIPLSELQFKSIKLLDE